MAATLGPTLAVHEIGAAVAKLRAIEALTDRVLTNAVEALEGALDDSASVLTLEECDFLTEETRHHLTTIETALRTLRGAVHQEA